ncbi:hypothetical protein ACHWQZ_G018890 [Mnemiopsis leidyi]
MCQRIQERRTRSHLLSSRRNVERTSYMCITISKNLNFKGRLKMMESKSTSKPELWNKAKRLIGERIQKSKRTLW